MDPLLGRRSLRLGGRVHLTDRSLVTVGLRFRFTGPVAPVTGRNRSNSNLNSKNSVQLVRTGIPTGLPAGLTGLNSNPNLKSHVQPVWTGIPAGLTSLPAGLTGLPSGP